MRIKSISKVTRHFKSSVHKPTIKTQIKSHIKSLSALFIDFSDGQQTGDNSYYGEKSSGLQH